MTYQIFRNIGANGVWAAGANLINSPVGYKIVRLPSGPIGATGPAAKQWLAVYVAGGLGVSRGLIAMAALAGAGTLTVTGSEAIAAAPAGGPVVWSVTLDGTFANPLAATGPEIAAALFATITWAAGNPIGVMAYPGGGAFTNGQVLRLWNAAAPDGQLNNAGLTFGGS